MLFKVIKKQFLFVAMLGLTTAFFAFKSGTIEEQEYWFQVVDGDITSTYLPDGPSEDCEDDDTTLEMCAARLEESQVNNPNTSNPSPNITDPSLAAERKYGEPEQQ